MLDISLEEGAELAVRIAAGHCAFGMPIQEELRRVLRSLQLLRAMPTGFSAARPAP
jgi:hypothetical protein